MTWAEVDPAASALHVTVVSSGLIVTALGDGRPLASSAVAASEGAAPVATASSAVALRDDSVAGVDSMPGPFEGARPRDRAKGQAAQRRAERELRMRAVAFRRAARASGFSAQETAEVLDRSPRTLSHWCQRLATDGLEERARGRPPQVAPAERRAAVTNFLTAQGPSLSLATLKAEYPDVARAELASLRGDYWTWWRAAHPVERCELDWLRPGSVWAMDFSHPPHLIDGCFRAILNVLDLASHQQLLWLAVDREDAATVMGALADLFEEHGAPLVLKSDNGPAFIARLTKGFLGEWSVFPLYSPPYCPRYNGGCERANRTLKELTAHRAESAGRAGFWTSDDLLEARRSANRLRRPWGAVGGTPEEIWSTRDQISLDKRENMWQHLQSGIGAALDQRGIDRTATLPHYTQTEIERIAAQPVLESLGLLHVTRRRIAPVI
jgi:transposase InsO family protein